MKKTLFFGLLAILALCVSCKRGSSRLSTVEGDTLRLKHAKQISIVKHQGFTMVCLADPWNNGKALHRYMLVPAGEDVPQSLPQDVTLVRVPLKKSVIATSVHCALTMELQRQDAIGGVCDLQYIHLPWVNKQCKEGKITDCGSGLQPSVEKIIELSPDAIFLSPFQNSGGYGKVENLGIPIIECADYMETSALGRAEWMKFYGMLFGAEHEADSIFNEVEKNYMDLKEKQTASGKERVKVLMDKLTGSVWYVPGGNSTIGKMLADAGADYPWADNTESGSLPLPFETVFEKGANADIWLFRYNAPKPIALPALLSEHQGYSHFKAFQNGQCYGCNTATSTFYEETPFHPDRLLRDFVTILQPEAALGAPRYFIKLSSDNQQ